VMSFPVPLSRTAEAKKIVEMTSGLLCAVSRRNAERSRCAFRPRQGTTRSPDQKPKGGRLTECTKERATPVSETQFSRNSRDRTGAKSVQRLACYSEAGQGSGFSHPRLDVTPGEQPASPFTSRTTDDSNTPSRWRDTSPRELPKFAIGQRTRLH